MSVLFSLLLTTVVRPQGARVKQKILPAVRCERMTNAQLRLALITSDVEKI